MLMLRDGGRDVRGNGASGFRRTRAARVLRLIMVVLVSGSGCGASAALAGGRSCLPMPDGSNPCPVTLRRPAIGPLSAMAKIGEQLFYDRELSGSGRLSCASCHVPSAHYASVDAQAFVPGGQEMERRGRRAVPSLMYLERESPLSIGPDNPVNEGEAAPTPAPAASGHVSKTAGNGVVNAVQLVPQGGLFWDGRADTLQEQAHGPLFDPAEMASSREIVIRRLRHAPYTAELMKLAGPSADRFSDFLVSEALFALARYQIENPAFHPYASRFDAWLEGRIRFTTAERKGYLAFNDPLKGNCAACHTDTVGVGGLPPLLTDGQYEALAVPRHTLSGEKSFDLGLCRAPRADIALTDDYCGMFRTPGLRNTADRRFYFHNGAYDNLAGVLDFYRFRETKPEAVYPVDRQGRLRPYDDIPLQYRRNIDVTDGPFDRHRGDPPAFDDGERDDIAAFLRMLTDTPQKDGVASP